MVSQRVELLLAARLGDVMEYTIWTTKKSFVYKEALSFVL